MSFENNAVLQHFIPQVEQRMNAINPNASIAKQKIFSFKVIDRDNFKVELESYAGKPIRSNLAFDDLFTFYHGSDKLRKNLEAEFGKYESNINTLTTSFLQALEQEQRDVTGVIFKLLTSKMLNFFRNPFSIVAVLNSVGDLSSFYPTDPKIREEFDLIDNAPKPQAERLCKLFNVTYSQYINWIKVLFLILVEYPGSHSNMLESIVSTIIEDNDSAKIFFIFHYSGEHEDKKVCLSDRSWVMCNGLKDDGLSMDFNINSNVFIRFATTSLSSIMPLYVNPHVIDNFKKIPRPIGGYVFNNDLDALACYNKNAILQCHEKVFSALPTIYVG